jgi:hypothetical protein
MKHTFASSSRHPASCRTFLIILGSCVVSEKKPARTSVMQNIFVLRAIHFSIGHFPFVRTFVLKAASSPNAGYFRVPDACNGNQRSTSILG